MELLLEKSSLQAVQDLVATIGQLANESLFQVDRHPEVGAMKLNFAFSLTACTYFTVQWLFWFIFFLSVR